MNIVTRGILSLGFAAVALVGCSMLDESKPQGPAVQNAELLSRVEADETSLVRLSTAINYVETNIASADESVREKANVADLKKVHGELATKLSDFKAKAQQASDEAAVESAMSEFETFSKGELSEFRVRVLSVNAEHVLTPEASGSVLEQAQKMVKGFDDLKIRADKAERLKPIESPELKAKVDGLRKSGAEMRTSILASVENLTKENLEETKVKMQELFDNGFKSFMENVGQVEEAIQDEAPIAAPSSEEAAPAASDTDAAPAESAAPGREGAKPEAVKEGAKEPKPQAPGLSIP